MMIKSDLEEQRMIKDIKKDMIIRVKKALESNDMLLICQICMHKYNLHQLQPLSLKCGHSLCKKCA